MAGPVCILCCKTTGGVGEQVRPYGSLDASLQAAQGNSPLLQLLLQVIVLQSTGEAMLGKQAAHTVP